MVGRKGVVEEVEKVTLEVVEEDEFRWGRGKMGARGIMVPPAIIVAIFSGRLRERERER